jgi:hypothetical protein
LSALDFSVSALKAGLRARIQRLSDIRSHPSAPNGGCIRGLIWAMLFESVSLLLLAGLIYAFHTLRP